MEYWSVTAEACNTFLYSCTPWIHHTYYRWSHFEGHLLDLGNFFCMNNTKRTSHNCKVLGICKNQTAIYSPMSHNDSVTECSFNFTEFDRLIGRCDKCVDFFKSPRIEKQVDTFVCRQLTFFVLLFCLFGTVLFFQRLPAFEEGFITLTRKIHSVIFF